MRRCVTPLVLLATAHCWFVGDARAASIIQNGTFTGTPVPTTFCSDFPVTNDTPPCVTDQLPVGWFNDPPGNAPNPSPLGSYSNVNQVSPGSEAAITPLSGYTGNYVAFASTAEYPNGNGQDCLFQNISTVVGESYTLTFDLAIVGTSTNLYMSPEWDSGANDINFDDQHGYNLGGNQQFSGRFGATTSSGSVQFQPFSFQVQAESTSTTLWFHGNDNGGAILLANVSLTQTVTTPEPSSLWLIGIGITMILPGIAHKSVRRPRA